MRCRAPLRCGAGSGGGQSRRPWAARGPRSTCERGCRIDRHDAGKVCRQLVVNGRPPARITLCRQETRRLVKEEHARGCRRGDRVAVDGDAVKRGQERGGRGHCLPVQRDPSFLDHPLNLPPGRNACAGEQFGDALRLVLAAGDGCGAGGMGIGRFCGRRPGLLEGRASRAGPWHRFGVIRTSGTTGARPTRRPRFFRRFHRRVPFQNGMASPYWRSQEIDEWCCPCAHAPGRCETPAGRCTLVG